LSSSGQRSLTVMVASDAGLQLLRRDLRQQKQKLIADNLPMTEQEAIKLWASYNRYTEELRQINDEKFRLVKEYGEQWGTMTNDEALIYIRSWLEVDQQVQRAEAEVCARGEPGVAGEESGDIFSAGSSNQHDDGFTVVVAAAAGGRKRE